MTDRAEERAREWLGATNPFQVGPHEKYIKSLADLIRSVEEETRKPERYELVRQAGTDPARHSVYGFFGGVRVKLDELYLRDLRDTEAALALIESMKRSPPIDFADWLAALSRIVKALRGEEE